MRFIKTSGFILLMSLAACQQTPPLPGQKVGKPYEVSGKRYYPEYDENYDKIGMASWYGPGFHGKYTASGEVYNQNALTAAHPTLPMPSIVRVTNLSNGESIIVRINDRGPFKSNRIIDLSKKSAESIGISSTTQVRVQFLKDETEEFIASYSDGGRPLTMEAFNDRANRDEDVASAQPEPVQDNNIETADNSSVADESANDSVPVESVSSQDLGAVNVKPLVKPSRHLGLVRDAYAEENVMPLPKKPVEKHIAVQADESSVDMSGYVIQAGAFSSQENAHKLGRKLTGIGKLDIDQIEVSGKPLWRVRLGPFPDKDDADDALDKVRSAGQPDARIVRL